MSDNSEESKPPVKKSSKSRIFSFHVLEFGLVLTAFSVIIWIGLEVRGAADGPVAPVSLAVFIAELLLVNGLLAGIIFTVRRVFVWLESIAREAVRKHLSLAGEALEGFVSAHSHALENLTGLIIGIVKILVYCLVIVVYVPIACSFFPRAEPVSEAVFAYITGPLEDVGFALLASFPDLLAIAIYFFITSYCLKFMRFFSEAVSENQIKLTWLPAESAMSVYHILRLVVIVFFIVAVFRRLPGSDNAEFQVIAGFLALLVSLSSSSAVGNFVAGLVLTFMQPFKKGDRVKIGNITGDVLDYSLVVTRVVTRYNERVTIPNLTVLSGEVTNYSSYASSRGVGLSVEVTIGYDVKWQLVHDLLLKAAENTAGVEQRPAPVILQTELGDSAVGYQLTCYTKRPRKLLQVRSELIASVMDAFNKAGVEILSPLYHAMRDGNKTTIPEEAA